MGIDIPALRLLLLARRRHGDFGATISLGRQWIPLAPEVVAATIGVQGPYYHNGHAELLLTNHFGATVVDAIDQSNWEGANILHDLNEPVPADLHDRYDTVLDFGTTEHVFDVRRALLNCTAMAKPGGQILHVVPANDFCGHGFWQFSPEVFFSLYAEDRGYRDTQVFVANVDKPEWFAEVEQNAIGWRTEVRSSEPTYVVARTVVGSKPEPKAVQQSDYAHLWRSTGESRNSTG